MITALSLDLYLSSIDHSLYPIPGTKIKQMKHKRGMKFFFFKGMIVDFITRLDELYFCTINKIN
jgi:hypothetical protein